MSPGAKKKKRAKTKAKRGSKSIFRRLISLTILCGAFGIGGFAALLTIVSRDLPTLNSLADYTPPMVNRVYDADGHLVAEIFTQRRTVVPVERLPAHVKNAFLAAEDAQFYNHEGLDYQAILAALVNEVKRKIFGGARRGGSTITQQTAKTFLLSPEQTYLRKLKDMILAKQIEETLTKEEILHLYLNQIYFGHGAYGIQEAARTYYGVNAEELSLGQSAVLASIPKSPNRINPFANVERVRERRTYVLEQMVKHRFATAKEVNAAMKEKIRVDISKPKYLGVGKYYTEEIRRMLVDKLGQDRINQGGLTIYTAMKSAQQTAADQALQNGLRAVDKRQGFRGPTIRLDPDQRKSFRERLDKQRAHLFGSPDLKKPKKTRGEKNDASLAVWDLSTITMRGLRDNQSNSIKSIAVKHAKKGMRIGGIVTRLDPVAKKAIVDLGNLDGVLPFSSMKWARPFSTEEITAPPKSIQDVLQEGDVILVEITKIHGATKSKKGAKRPWVDVALDQMPMVEGALVAVEPFTHRVIAMSGGYAFERSSFNRATQAKRQPGSGFKPFIYAAGIESKRFTPVGYFEEGRSRLITDAPKVFFDPWKGSKWSPKNAGNRYRGDITLRKCLTFSVNTCSISVLEKVGLDEIHRLSNQMNLMLPGQPFPKNLTLALGTGELHPLQLINAYTIFPNGGSWSKPVLLEKVKDLDGKIIYEHESEEVSVISSQTAYIMSDLMTDVVNHGTGRRANALKKPVAGKTGTTNRARSAWFTGYTPLLVAGAYVGFDDNRSLGVNEYGGKAALPIWLEFMTKATKKHDAVEFKMPDGLEMVAIEEKSGLRYASNPSPIIDDEVTESPAQPQAGQGEPTEGGKKNTLSALISKVATALSGDRPEQSPENNPPVNAQPPPPADAIDAPLPEGVYEEVFITGTSPTQLVRDEAPPPLELFELSGGLGP